MPDDLTLLRQQYDADLHDWTTARDERAKDMRYLAGDPWEDGDKKKRDESGRPYLTFDELSQYVNQIVNEVRAHPRAVQYAPTKPGTSEELSDFYADKMREIEYRSNAQLAYTRAFENAVQGGYGFVRVASEFERGSVDRQELVIKPVMDPNTVVPNWDFQHPDLSDMRRCFVLEWRPLAQFRQQFPKAAVQDFSTQLNDSTYSRWVKEDRILLAEAWEVRQQPVKLLLVQPPPVSPPKGMGLRPAVLPPPVTIKQADWQQMPTGSKVIKEREEFVPQVVQQLVNGVETLAETSWPGPYIPIAGCMGRMLYLDEGGDSKRVLLSAVRLARDPFMAYCFYRTCEIENVGMTTKNPYWAYAGQITPEQQQEIAKSLHEPVTVLFAQAKTPQSGDQILPLPQRNINEPAIQALSLGAEETRRAIQSAMATNFLPTDAQRINQKSGVALDKIDQARQKGSFHFVDHFEMMLRHVGRVAGVAMPTFYDTARQVLVRKADDSTAHVWVNQPQQRDSLTLSHDLDMAVTISSGPSVDSTREAGSEFADTLLQSTELMQLIGPQKAQQIAALAIKLKVKQTGIGAIGEQIVDIIDPKSNGDIPPAQLMAHIQQADQLLQMAQQQIQQLQQQAQTEQIKGQLKILSDQLKAKSQERIAASKQMTDMLMARMDNETRLAVAEEAAKTERMNLFMEERSRLGVQAHELGMAAADAAHAAKEAAATRDHERQQQVTQAALQPPAGDGKAA